jgi:hypothetical protein
MIYLIHTIKGPLFEQFYHHKYKALRDNLLNYVSTNSMLLAERTKMLSRNQIMN